MKIGDILRNLETGTYGIVNFSSFRGSYSIHMLTDYEGQKVLGKTLAMTPEEIYEKWMPVSALPAGYVLGKYGCPEKVDENAAL